MSGIQNVYEICKASFSLNSSGVVPSSSTIQKVRAALDKIECADVGLDWEKALRDDWLFQCYQYGLAGSKDACRVASRCSAMSCMQVARETTWAQPNVTYLHLYEKENSFSMGIFCLPTSAIIPLHDHPGMTVFSKLLYGSMHVRSYDWVDPFCAQQPGSARLAKPVTEDVVTAPCETAVLFPTSGGNIHALTALTPCAILDVLTPPYSLVDRSRHCIYYSEVGVCGNYCSSESEQELDPNGPVYVWLEDLPPSKENFIPLPGSYCGQKIKP